MNINEMNVSSYNNCKRDNNSYNQVKAKAIDKRDRTAINEKTFDEMLADKLEDMKEDFPTPKFDAMCDVLEDIYSLKDLNVEARWKNIESRQNNKELENILGVSKDYYRDRYFALLRVIAFCTDVK